MTYTLTVEYTWGTQVYRGLTAEQTETGMGAFVRDMLHPESGIVSLKVETER